MMLDNSQLIATGEPATNTERIGVGVAIGGGVGAHVAIGTGTLVGGAWITALAAAGGGVMASYIAGKAVGEAIGNIEVVRDYLVEVFEYYSPIPGMLRPDIIITWPEAENNQKYGVMIGNERFDINFYVESLAHEGISMDQNFNAGADYYSDIAEATHAAEQVKLIGQDPGYYFIGAGGVAPGLIP